jgi:hypothetical protein
MTLRILTAIRLGRIAQRNFLDVYTYDRWSGRLVPAYEQGEQFLPSSVEMSEVRWRAARFVCAQFSSPRSLAVF